MNTLQVIQTLAAEYVNAPAAVLSVTELLDLRHWVRSQWMLLPVRIRVVTHDVGLSEAMAHCRATGTLLVSSAHNSHPYLSFMENIMFRAVHDWHHLYCGSDDSFHGEVETYRYARSIAPQSIHWILRSEIVLQAAACLYYGDFQEQKLVRS